jgi:murein DD-endopeptidase MepM/ murein hydrolase activator NlpD
MLFGLFVLFALLAILTAPTTIEARSSQAVQAPPGYIVFNRLPWDTTQQNSVRVTRTGRLYKSVYDTAGLTGYTNVDYHPALDQMTINQRGAIDFTIPTGTRVLAVAGGKVVSRSSCQVGVKHPNGMVAYYLHMSRVDVALNATVSAGQRLGLSGASCGASGAHLHFALWNGVREVPVAFSNVPAQRNNGKTCPATVICPSKNNYAEFRYGGSASPPPPPPPTPTPVPSNAFVNGSSALTVTVPEVRLSVCATGLTGKTVYATLYRGPVGSYSERLWRYSKIAPMSCVIFADMDGAGDTLAGVTYYTVVSLSPISDADAKARRTSCYAATGARQLCDARSR